MGKNRVLVIVLFIALGLVPLTTHAAEELFDTKAAADHIEKGIAHLKAKSYDAAISEFEESASISPEAEAYYYLGYAYYMKSRTQDGENRKKSLEYFNNAYEIDPNFTPSRYKPAEPVPPTEQQPQEMTAPTGTPETAQPAAETAAKPAEPAPSSEQPKQ
jgi:tetratricopeptide (TPR) repeat protein